MAKRSITDAEIALIKAMCARGMKNRDIQFFFNRPDRAVNSGRITDIRNGKYSDSSAVPAASPAELDAFLAANKPATDVPAVVSAPIADDPDPVSDANIRRLFRKDGAGAWWLMGGETDQVECKTSFGLRHPGPWMRAVAALANNRGGYVVFGVKDKDPDGNHRVVGLSSDEFAKTDPAALATRLRSMFDPTPRVQIGSVDLDGLPVGILHVEQHPSRPVIATKTEEPIREGDILFRYPGQSNRITYSDLRAMLDARDVQARSAILPMVARLLELGPDRAMVADLVKGQLADGRAVVELDEDVIKKLLVVKEGEFVEVAGAPALRLIGDLRPVAGAGGSVTKKGLVLRNDMRRDFLEDRLEADALDYVRVAVELPGNDWLPIRFFGRKAGLSDADLLDFIEKDEKAPEAQKRIYRTRLATPDTAYVQARGPGLSMLRRLEAGEDLVPRNAREIRHIAEAVRGIQRPLNVDAGRVRALLLRCLDSTTNGRDENAKTAVRRAIARLDELLS